MSIPSKIDSKLLDVPCDLIAAKMLERLSWLSNAYGRCETYEEGEGRERKSFPVVFTGGNTGRKMLKLMPDSKLGNFMFIDTADIYDTSVMGRNVEIDCEINMIFWFNYEKVYPTDHQNRTIENVKYEVINALRNGVPGVRLDIENMKIREGARNIYSFGKYKSSTDSYFNNEASKGYLKRPYGGFSIQTKLNYIELCV